MCCHPFSLINHLLSENYNRSFRPMPYASSRSWNQLPDPFVSLVSPVSIHLLIHLSTHLCYRLHSQHDHPSNLSIRHSTLSLQAQKLFSTNPSSHLNRLFFTHWTAFMMIGLDWTYHARRFIFSFSFKFFVYSLPVRFSLHTHYRIANVSVRRGHFLTLAFTRAGL